LSERFSFDKKDQYIPTTEELKVEAKKIKYSFPPHSFTQIKVNMKD